ncbi:g8645 [Coccomyxa viridis]|uniref:G8645 protein n=1 Tax=Coccomyxa viridis TaxID=1274662 RepID=A0ABP1G0X2_9CHLO
MKTVVAIACVFFCLHAAGAQESAVQDSTQLQVNPIAAVLGVPFEIGQALQNAKEALHHPATTATPQTTQAPTTTAMPATTAAVTTAMPPTTQAPATTAAPASTAHHNGVTLKQGTINHPHTHQHISSNHGSSTHNLSTFDHQCPSHHNSSNHISANHERGTHDDQCANHYSGSYHHSCNNKRGIHDDQRSNHNCQSVSVRLPDRGRTCNYTPLVGFQGNCLLG